MTGMKKRLAIRMLGAVLAAAALAGCGTLSGETGGADEQLASDVRERLHADPVTGRENIGVSATEGVVTLGGNLPNENVRYRAKDIARGTEGVKGVVDNFHPRR